MFSLLAGSTYFLWGLLSHAFTAIVKQLQRLLQLLGSHILSITIIIDNKPIVRSDVVFLDGPDKHLVSKLLGHTTSNMVLGRRFFVGAIAALFIVFVGTSVTSRRFLSLFRVAIYISTHILSPLFFNILILVFQSAVLRQEVGILKAKLLEKEKLLEGMTKQPSIAMIVTPLVLGFYGKFHQLGNVRQERHGHSFLKDLMFKFPTILARFVTDALAGQQFGQLAYHLAGIIRANRVVRRNEEFLDILKKVIAVHEHVGEPVNVLLRKGQIDATGIGKGGTATISR
mmetsp:Transcript_24520/g.40622  ORF Transcript_24520/g.40622 Transcript_24520/m.40622 type:complete len:285 (-) Transcript_24520:443-1297(-)